ncbi:uncharacterized protein UBRO_08130 [Ustilago bromivora]|uniref:Effector family protein Eff1 n=1 Tax=Ustilago bromivora TaxID=307758 RepID=A0A1K0HB28_9BASI|nr:uncharacterized protein UBRO_08130 [Ustilago bromivora]
MLLILKVGSLLSILFFLITFEIVEGQGYSTAGTSAARSQSSALKPFLDRLLENQNLASQSSIYATTDLTQQSHKHHLLTQYIYQNGQDFNPQIVYLGTDPKDPSAHLAVKPFAPDVDLADDILRNGKFHRWKNREGLLAMRLRSREEPEFAGIIWLTKWQMKKGMKWEAVQTFDQLQSDLSLGVIERVLHHLPMRRK